MFLVNGETLSREQDKDVRRPLDFLVEGWIKWVCPAGAGSRGVLLET